MRKILFIMIAMVALTGCGKGDEPGGTVPPPPPTPGEKFDVTVDLKMPGTLAANVPNITFKTIKIKGNLNGTDIKYIRGIISYISILDLEEANIVEGGESYYETTYKTKNNIIGEYMFAELDGNFQIRLPKSVTEIGDSAFLKCKGLSSIKLPENINIIGDSAFEECTALKSILLPNGITKIGRSVFKNCSSLTKANIPSNSTFKIISFSLFHKCSKLADITIPENIKEIESNAFNGCNSLISVDIPDNVTKLNWHAFSYCGQLKKATISKSISLLPMWAFFYCKSLQEVHCRAITPPVFEATYEIFPYDIPKLYVPKGSLAAYQNSPWKEFFISIVEE